MLKIRPSIRTKGSALQISAFVLACFHLSSCFSEYKTIPATNLSNSGVISVKSELEAPSVFPVIPKKYQSVLYLTNNGNQTICLSHITVTLKRHSRKNEKFLRNINVDSVQLKPGEKYRFSSLFAKHSPLFFPHKVTLTMTASLQDSSNQTVIDQSQQFVRYMYVNLAGN